MTSSSGPSTQDTASTPEDAPRIKPGTPIRDVLDLEDFGVVPMTVADTLAPKPEEPAAEPVPDPNLVTMTHEEADAAREAAFRAGYEKGTQDREKALQDYYAASLESLTTAFRAENDRRSQVLMGAAKSYLMTVVDIVRNLTALDASVLAGMQRDLIVDAVAFVKECDGPVTVQCSPADAQRLQAILHDNQNVRIEAVQGREEGAIHITSATNSIAIDPEQWRKSVAEKIVAAVTALAEQRGGRDVHKA
ncbi:hypothetical protein [Komagataeibacter saccharivorans]|uniref:hypothetical protein n=1 Tax=Komagataeibacter saccharivorans TaxID=265959 RepID=UPI0039ED20E5